MAPFFSWRVRRSGGVKKGGKDITDSCSDWMDGWRWKYGVSSRAFFFVLYLPVAQFLYCMVGVCVLSMSFGNLAGGTVVSFFRFFLLSICRHPPLYLLNLESHLASYIPGKKN